MKKTLLLLLFSVFAFGQNRFVKTDSLKFIENKNEILKKLGGNFTLIESEKQSAYTNYEKYKNPNDEVLYIVYGVYNEGENIDLKKKGVKRWTIKSIASDFTHIFNFYQTNYEKDADKERIQKIGTNWKATQKEAFIRRTSQVNLWEITFS